MKKNFKKVLALTCTFTMLASTAVFADTSVTGTGSSGIENDDSTAPASLKCVIPAVNAGTYDFTIDVDKLLPEYDKDDTDGTVWDGSSNVFFATTGTAASVAHATASTSFYVKSIKVLGDSDAAASLTAFYALFDGDDKTLSDFAGLALKYYVWQPAVDGQSKPTGEGMYTKLDASNLATFFDLTFATPGDNTTAITEIALKANYMAGAPANVCNGTVYVDTYAEANSDALLKEKVATYITVGGSDSSPTYTVNTTDVLYDGASGKTDATLTASDLSALSGDITAKVVYTKAVTKYINTSATQTITNKSTFPVAVSAKVEVKGTSSLEHGLTFSSTDDFTAVGTDETNKTAAMYMAIVSGTNAAAVSDSNAEAYYVLSGAKDATNKFQSTDTNTTTGSHKYVQYEAPDGTFAKADFQIKAIANAKYDEETKTGFDWDKYVEDITAAQATIAKPELSVVYDFVVVSEGVTTETKTGTDPTFEYTYETVYTDDNNMAYTVTDPTTYNAVQATPVTSGWAEGEEAITRTMTLRSGSVSYTFTGTDKPTGTLTAVTTNGQSRSYQVSAGNISYNATTGVLTFNSTATNVSFATAGDYTIVATIGGKNYKLVFTK
ncbi:MAG: hypothetical protein IJD58_08630 [Lachnospiraceae bacterium]|nr:hypothetical protein [Lachnospiraceae bacterium]